MNELNRIATLAGINEAIDDDFELSDEEMARMDAAEFEKWHTAVPLLHKKLEAWLNELIDSYPEGVNVDHDEYDRVMGPLAQRLEDYSYRVRTGNL